jgi:large subunit ribosomal protein L14
MIKTGTYLNVCDNSGAKKVYCIKLLSDSKRVYSYLGDLILVSVKKLRKKRKNTSKVQKGDLCKALIVHTKTKINNQSGISHFYFDNSVVLLNKQNKLIGTRILSPLASKFRYTRFFKLISLSLVLI